MQASGNERPRPRPRRLTSVRLAAVLAVGVAIAGAAGVITAADRQVDDVDRIENLDDTLAAQDGPAVNYLLIGSDSREGLEEDVGGRRSDTIMVLRQEEDGDGAALLSLNRDLWVTLADTGNEDRINAAYNRGADVLAATITENFGIPINHVVDVDFLGFQDIVDTIGGTTICFEFPARDFKSGLDQPAGCNRLDGEQALAYARSRTFEELRDGEWVVEPTGDIGRVKRQQHFLATTVNETLAKLQSDPFLVSELINGTSGSLRLDPNLDPLAAAGTLRKAFGTGLSTYTLPAEVATIDDKSVLLLIEGSQTDEILNYFQGNGPLPTTVPAG